MKKQNKSYLKYMLRAVSIQFRSTPFHMVFMILIIMVEAIGLTARTIVNEKLFDTIIRASQGTRSFVECLLPIVIMAMVTLGQQAMNGLKFWYWPVIGDKTAGISKKHLFEKLQRVDAVNFENSEFLDDLNKAKQGIWPLSSVALNVVNVLSFNGIYAISLGIYLFSVCPILIVMLILAFIPALVAQMVRLKLYAKLEEESAPIRRENDYYYKAICDREYFKETRVLGAFKYFSRCFSNSLEILVKKQWKTEKKTTLIDACLNVLSFLGMGISVLLLFFATMNGNVPVAAFAAIFTSLKTIFDVMDAMMKWDITGIGNDMGKVVNYIDIMDYTESNGIKGTKSEIKSVIADRITFKYPGINALAIDNVSLDISDGETIAIVGENGSGKSTLVKLLTGIYKPDRGDVVIDGLNTKNYDAESIRKGISGVFQSFQKYKLSLKDNVSISDLDISDNIDDRISQKIEEIGFDLDDRFEYDTILSPEFGGIDLSGGQWQRIAIARGVYRNHDFIVLDEPTAAIDPIEEDRVFTQFKDIVKGKNAIVVTHRLGSVRLVDRIVVMDKGQIVDFGTHEQLIAKGRKYSELWKAQAAWYKREQ